MMPSRIRDWVEKISAISSDQKNPTMEAENFSGAVLLNVLGMDVQHYLNNIKRKLQPNSLIQPNS